MEAAAASRVGAGMLGEIEETSLDEVRHPVICRYFSSRYLPLFRGDVDGAAGPIFGRRQMLVLSRDFDCDPRILIADKQMLTAITT